MKGYIFEVRKGINYSYIFAESAKGARGIYEQIVGGKPGSIEKRSKRIDAEIAKDKCINL